MTSTRRSCFCATYTLVLLFLGVSRAGAWGALAVGVSPDNLQSATAPVVGKATEDEAGRPRSVPQREGWGRLGAIALYRSRHLSEPVFCLRRAWLVDSGR